MSDLVQSRPQREVSAVIDPVAVFDTHRFEHMQRIAAVMAHSSLIPDGLCMTGPKTKREPLPFEQVLANCFLVVNQAARWGMDPFAVAQCCSVVHGRLCYEGKLVAAVLEAKLGIQLAYQWNDQTGDAFGIVVTGVLPGGEVKSIDGTVGRWKTTGDGSPWPKQPKLQLAYRGAREWARLYAPGVMLGVYSDDELDNLVEDARARRATQPRPSLAERLGAAAGQGFSREHVERETAGEQQDEEQGGLEERLDTPTETSPVSPGEQEDRPEASAPNSPPGLSSESFHGYSQALARATNEKSLASYDTAASKRLPAMPAREDIEILQEIYRLHERRIRGELSAEEVALQVRELAGA